ncbi:MAG: hypothetical protein ACE5DS_01665 [Kiloniellaceae bacterium]
MRNEPNITKFQADVTVDFSALSTADLEAMAEAGREIVEIYRVLAKTGDNLVGEILKGHETFFEWDHYPPGDVYDHQTHGQFYYHAHPLEERFQNEHGHFHTFIRPRGMPPGIKPAPVPGFKKPDDPDDALSHLIAVAMTKQGFPFRLFTVNRWVTGEMWYTQQDVTTLLDYFKIDHTQPSWPVNRWVTALVRLFKPQIALLLAARDRNVFAWAEQHPDRDVYEDRELEVTSFADISAEEQTRAAAAALLARK